MSKLTLLMLILNAVGTNRNKKKHKKALQETMTLCENENILNRRINFINKNVGFKNIFVNERNSIKEFMNTTISGQNKDKQLKSAFFAVQYGIQKRIPTLILHQSNSYLESIIEATTSGKQ